jgi:hypothetical protein
MKSKTVTFFISFLVSYVALDATLSLDLLPLYQLHEPLGIFGLEKALANAKNTALKYAMWIGIALLALAFGYAAIQTISTRFTNAALDALMVALRNPFVLGTLVGTIAVTAFFLRRTNVTLHEGDHVFCKHQPKTIYRYTGGQLRHYPSPAIATSWGSVWISASNNNHKEITKTQCDGLKKGPAMPMNLVEGDHVACERAPGTIYRYTGGRLRLYPDPAVAKSWGSIWISASNNNHKLISTQQCNQLELGPPMPMNLVEGDHVACERNPGTIYRYTGGRLRLYPDPTVAKSWGSIWISASNNNHKLISTQQCNQLELGPPMPMNLTEGDHVACQHEPGKVYRFTQGVLRHYPSPAIASSWGSVWISATNNNHRLITKPACDATPKGPPMTLNTSR